MEDNKTSDIPLPCTNGCGFYGNPIFQNMCSKCFGQQQKSNESLHKMTTSAATTAAATIKEPTPTPAAESPSSETIVPPKNITNQTKTETKDRDQVETDNNSDSASGLDSATVVEDAKDDKPIQKNKGRCFICRIKIPLTKQLTNKCRCDYVYCDSHRYPDKHQCLFDHASMDKDILAKNNPKLNDRPRGGRSFQRLDSV